MIAGRPSLSLSRSLPGTRSRGVQSRRACGGFLMGEVCIVHEGCGAPCTFIFSPVHVVLGEVCLIIYLLTAIKKLN